ncbi:thiopeptide-type bacteriocin biosynthesis protein [Anoxybacteroides amylolyticum]|uniref:Thiopeptide-type bacteriocin biosynthesis domain protein n=1 Tax=Anoxybacteroides amylolyticum TaxID=294699 RepID=A0A167TSK5_9BACL|nr:thiopeptide-type bacteriocin biosynthesis protein [Anoxybacillus amylolyticus]ANB62154.1 thiopeptide-type bacteriocin biosynthesis domain protein [Anoxybacillus amylolyticus]
MNQEWVYYNIYPSNSSLMDFVVEDIVRNAYLEVGKITEISKWFFIRYQDHSGTHVRLRFLVSVQSVNEVIEILEKLFEEKLSKISRITQYEPKRLVPIKSSQHFNNGQESRFELALYEPEIDKYGGETGLSISEELFQYSSEICLDVTPGIIDGTLDRFIIGLKYMNESLQANFEHTDAILDFLEKYIAYWSGEHYSSIGTIYKKNFIQSAKKRVALTKNIIEQGYHRMNFKNYANSLKSVIDRISAVNGEKKTSDLLFHYMHMMNNRLGIWPIEEAYLAALLKVVYMNQPIQGAAN